MFQNFSWSNFLLGFGVSRAIDLFLPGLGSVITGTLRGAINDATGEESVASVADVRERFGFRQDPDKGVTWLEFRGNEDYNLAQAFYPQHGVNFVQMGVSPEGLPSLAILTEDEQLALGVSHDFWQAWGDYLAEMNYGSVADGGVDLDHDLIGFDL